MKPALLSELEAEIASLKQQLADERAAHKATKKLNCADYTEAGWIRAREIESERDQLRAALAQAEADTRRLDWFEQHGELVWQRISMPGWWFWREKEQNRGSADTLRKAIDFAMK